MFTPLMCLALMSQDPSRSMLLRLLAAAKVGLEHRTSLVSHVFQAH